MNRCAYCLREHSRRWACCCPEHTRKMQAWRGAVTAGHTRARARIMRRVHHRARVAGHWRQLALGVNVADNLRAVFGVTPDPDAPGRDAT